MADRTDPAGTWTTAGFIPHLPFHGLRLPVRVEITFSGPRAFGSVAPDLRYGRYIYALPGGGTHIPEVR